MVIIVVIKCPKCGEEISLPESYDEERFAGEVKCTKCEAPLLVGVIEGEVRTVTS
ncbi:MAG: hypothetical protein U9N41_06450 [Euryarchaeota archaeon]|nr:hypothetical protein [Euryarchaeota archaeon]